MILEFFTAEHDIRLVLNFNKIFNLRSVQVKNKYSTAMNRLTSMSSFANVEYSLFGIAANLKIFTCNAS